jgi:arylsulfatase A-like enzyme
MMKAQTLRSLGIGIVVAGLIAGGGYFLFSGPAEHPDNRPVGTVDDLDDLQQRDDVNVLFILIDTLRADRLSVYGYDRETSPTLDYLAGTGIRFAENRAQSSWTKASMASLWTGLYPARTGVRRHVDVLSEEARTPAEILREEGFVTAGIWRNGWVAPNFGFSQGFEIYQTPAAKQAPAAMRQEARGGRIDGTDIDVIYSGIEFIRAHRDQRWFLYLHLMDVHQYITTEEAAIFGDSYSDSYDNSIRWTDLQLGLLLRELYEMDIESRTLVVVASDHGEAFGEHGTEGHARDLFGEVTLTPLIISPPFKMTPPAVVSSRTQNVDIWPTVLDMLGVSVPSGADGISWRPLLTEGDGSEGNPLLAKDRDIDFAQLDRNWGQLEKEAAPILAFRQDSLRLIHDTSHPDQDQLFDVAADPREKVNLSATLPGDAARLLAEAKAIMDSGNVFEGGAPQVELDEMHLRQLRALGYSIE